MPAIRVLSENLVNQIAAGEVVERPASVVKELLENAVDAQAARIRVELEEAGKKLIRVSDDGLGMAAEDVPLALASHSTSKIASADDLGAILTLGFRGEALASIAAVADVRIVSRTRDAIEAAEAGVSGGRREAPRPASGPVGTTVEVRNLFRYVPARRKFLKTDSTEMGHITEHVARIALAYPSVHLTVTHNGRSVYELPPTDSVRERIAAFFGSDLAESLVAVSSEEPAGKLWGLVGPPHAARATASAQYLFINGRFVRDRGLLHALREAYRGMLEGSRQPVGFLFLTVPPDRVDVNVHPTKIEVRLRDAHLLYGQVLAAVRERLLGPGMAPDVSLAAAARSAPHDAAATEPPAPPEEGETGARPGPDQAAREERVRQAVADFLRSPAASGQARLPFSGRVSGQAAAPAKAGGETRPPPPGERRDRPSAMAQSEIQNPESEMPSVRAMQIHNTYLIAETADGILIVDQHALHERVLFEDLMARLEAGPLEGQRLLVPVTVDLSDRDLAALEEHRAALGRMGIEAEPIGPRSVAIHAFPVVLAKADPEGTLRDFLAWARACDSPPAARQVLEQLAHVAACRAAVKAGDPLKPEEVEALLGYRDAAGLAATCPHGRPTALVLRKADLEKQFGRDYVAARRKESGAEPMPF
jgi:DNA mismatch repair protein MutL